MPERTHRPEPGTVTRRYAEEAMHAIATLRSLLAAPARGLIGVLLIAAVIAGVVAMHSMSGSPSAHLLPVGIIGAQDIGHRGHPPASPDRPIPNLRTSDLGMSSLTGSSMTMPARTSAVPGASAPEAVVLDRPVGAAQHGDAAAADCSQGCGSHGMHDMTTAMCLMVLVVLLTLAAPPTRFLNTMLQPVAQRVLATMAHSRPAAAPSLHALGISRT